MLNLIQNELCHPESVILIDGPTLYCKQCQKNLFPVYPYITRRLRDNFRSSELAQAYYEWTGDTNVPMNFTLMGLHQPLDGIFPVSVVGQSINRVVKSIRLLRALNAPFTNLDFRMEDHYSEDMNTFLVDFLNIIYENSHEESSRVRAVLDTILKAMYQLLSSKDVINPFETYFKTLVPFVQQCFPYWQPISSHPENSNLAMELMDQFEISNQIRRTFSSFSIPFDMIHVMVCCYVCSSNMNAVANWVLDFVARICRGHFFWKQRYPNCIFIVQMAKILHHEISYRKRTDLYQVLKVLRNGESAEHYSTFLKSFHDLQMFLHGNFASSYDEVKEMAFSLVFPAICFQDHKDQLGFMIGYNHIIQTLQRNNGIVPKGTFRKAKNIHETIKRFIQKIQDYEQRIQENLLWTVDTFQAFLTSDSTFEQEILDLFQTLAMNEEDNKDGNN